ncbi:MAG: O-antigen ligase family protein [Firmicutes bacterium]|nr:O-antigen ligase family protein [Bacillota bacterium]
MEIAGFLIGGLALVQAAVAPPFPRGWVAPAERGVLPFRVTGLWSNPNRTGLFLAFLLPLFLVRVEEGKERTRRANTGAQPAGGGLRPVPPARAAFFMVLTGLTATALLFTYARTAWVAAVVALFLYWGPREWVNRRRLVAFILVLIGFFPSVAGRIGRNPFASGTMNYRLAVWQETWQLVQKYPLTGGGEKELRAALRPWRVDHAHNHYLQIAAEKGVPAFLLYGWLLFRFWQAARRPGSTAAGRARGDDRLRRGVVAAFGGQVFAGLTESIWAVPLGSFLFWFAFALVTAERDKPEPAVAGESKRSSR